MITEKNLAEGNRRLSLSERRAYMQLPLEERRRRLAAQADAMIEHYGQEFEQKERLAWQGGTLSSPTSSAPRRGDIWLVNLDPTVGSEIQKTRPTLHPQVGESLTADDGGARPGDRGGH